MVEEDHLVIFYVFGGIAVFLGLARLTLVIYNVVRTRKRTETAVQSSAQATTVNGEAPPTYFIATSRMTTAAADLNDDFEEIDLSLPRYEQEFGITPGGDGSSYYKSPESFPPPPSYSEATGNRF